MLGLGSYTFRWSVGHKDIVPIVPMTHGEMLEIAVQHELKLVQIADNAPLHLLSAEELDALANKARTLGVTLEIGTQSFNAEEMREYLNIAEVLNAKIVRVALDGPDSQIPVPELAASFRELISHAQRIETRIAVENHFNYPALQLAQLMEEISDPTVGVCLDVANSICAGEWPMETVATLAPYTINLHLKDYDIVPDPYGVGFAIHGTPLGQGRTDCKAVLAALPQERDINVILEHWLPLGDNIVKARALEHRWLNTSVVYARQELGL